MTHTKLFIVDFKQITLRNVNVHHAAITSSAALDGRKNEGNKGGGGRAFKRQTERERGHDGSVYSSYLQVSFFKNDRTRVYIRNSEMYVLCSISFRLDAAETIV